MSSISVATGRREELIDVSDAVVDEVEASAVRDGTCLVFSPHTTCAVTINEGWDPAVTTDALKHLGELVPREADWAHAEGNSDAHIKAMLVGPSVLVPVSEGRLLLGRWQRVFLCEFDGPRQRELWVTVSGAS